MTSIREQGLSEFIDAWNAGERPDVDDYIARVPTEEQAALGEELLAFVTLAPTPSYSDEALQAIRAEPAVAAALTGETERGGLFGALFARMRERLGLSAAEVAGE